ncbi:hypothetical protein FisN_30Hu064 [Fistulifera solaris]|uniref:DDE Tnp4 domain-containing protein n=1 Tax=Fistulifera solaris TaxID=1519565 RepID=A0A1Z5K6E9_FISSO|nr:hypothetical protein FisN_30Hu064 [Fistulifera solaris]|eukprot:GAX21863.1 hypothetical protein FisN_30Hu064 [Fistulifera solaris]
MLFSEDDVLVRGLHIRGVWTEGKSRQWAVDEFKSIYGSTPLVLAKMWHDLVTSNLVRLTEREKKEWGFDFFLRAHCFMFTYPKNVREMARSFKINQFYVRGRMMWRWIERIALLAQLKIVWPSRFDDPASERFIITVDGTDFKCTEPQHDTLPIDRQFFSQKFNHGAVKYEVALSIFEPKCVWMNGPHPGGRHDLTILREGGLLQQMIPGKLAIADRGYRTSVLAEQEKLSLPNDFDGDEVKDFKGCARSRHESYNGRLKKFGILDKTFRHRPLMQKHGHAFRAVVVTQQYQLENGSILFEV